MNGATLALVENCLNKSANIPRKFDISKNEGEQVLRHYLLKELLPNLIIKIIGTNNEQSRYSLRASIQNAFKTVIHTLMEETSE